MNLDKNKPKIATKSAIGRVAKVSKKQHKTPTPTIGILMFIPMIFLATSTPSGRKIIVPISKKASRLYFILAARLRFSRIEDSNFITFFASNLRILSHF